MANTNLKFYRGAAPTSPAAGMIWFDKVNSTIKVYTGTAWESYAGKLIDATWDEAKKALTLVKQDGTSSEISFKDVASASALAQEIVDRKAGDTALDDRVKILEAAKHVDSLGGETGAITVDGVGGESAYKVKLAMTGQKLGATISGLGTAAAKAVEDFDIAGAATTVKSEVVNTISVGEGLEKSGEETSPKIDVVVDPVPGNALSKSATGLKVVVPAAAEYSIVKGEASSDYAAVYHLTKGGVNVGAAINIPKDMVVKSGAVVTNPEGQKEGTYIVLTLANATEDKIYIPVDSLIEYVTSGSATGDMVVIDVSNDHKVTATITDGTVTKSKLVTAVQTSLGLADTAVQNGEGVSAEGAYVSTTVEKVDKKLKVSAALKVQKMSTAGAEAKGLAEASDVKSYVTDEIAKVTKVETLNAPDAAVAGKFVTAVSQENGVITVSRESLTASDIPEIGIAKVTGLQTALDGKATAEQGALAVAAVRSVDEGTANGTISVITGEGAAKNIKVHGLGNAAYASTTVDITENNSGLAVAGAVKTYVDNKIASNTDLVWASFE